MDQIFLYLWLVTMTVTLIAAPFVRKLQGRKPPNQENFVSAAFALGGAIALMKVFIKVIFTQTQIQDDLEWDGTLALCISISLGTYLSLKEVKKLF